jgi:hypothetical protein
VDDSGWYAEIEGRRRRRFRGVYLLLAFAALMAVGFANTQRMMHDGDLRPASATIVALGTGSSGEPTMTSRFQDADGAWHTDTQPASYHYARGEPRVGETVDYLYGIKPISGFYAVPRADAPLRWLFGAVALLFALLGAGAAWLILRERNYRRRLLATARREPLAAARLGERAYSLPAGAAGTQRVALWRLEGRYFDPAAGEYVDCASDWQPAPAPADFDPARAPPVFVDPLAPSRYWLPARQATV